MSAVAESLPPVGTVERWAVDFLRAREVEAKLRPSPPPAAWERDPPVRDVRAPGRPADWILSARSERTPRAGALRARDVRARLVHTFLHHELQAAELFCWALLRYPSAPRAFRRGLLNLARDELRHLELYRAHLAALGEQPGAFPVRDWFWERVPSCATPAAFCALVGLGLEGGNLEHTARFARAFRAAGDEPGAGILERVGEEEIAHVRFGRVWFRRFTGKQDFEAWRAALPEPLTPSVLRGRPLARAARRRAGLDEGFLDALEGWGPAGGPAAAPGGARSPRAGG